MQIVAGLEIVQGENGFDTSLTLVIRLEEQQQRGVGN